MKAYSSQDPTRNVVVSRHNLTQPFPKRSVARLLRSEHNTRLILSQNPRSSIAVCCSSNESTDTEVSPSSSSNASSSPYNYLLPILASTLIATPAAFAASQALNTAFLLDDGLREGIASGFLLIFFSEIGDKTFFIALLLAAQAGRLPVFAGTFGALAVMTVISVFLGRGLHEIDALLPGTMQSIPIDDVIAVILLIVFGVQTIQSADDAAEEAAEEREEAEKSVSQQQSAGSTAALIASTFALVFAAEWGDKSFIATIALAAASNPYGVTLGAVGGHGVATVLAVLGGSILSQYTSERAIKLAGGSLFLVFAALTVVDIVQKVTGGA